MATIAVLDQNTIDKIAAGEVVERPASRGKGAGGKCNGRRCDGDHRGNRDGGISLVRITDNGSGIPAEQVPLAFLRHAHRARSVPWKNSCRLHLLASAARRSRVSRRLRQIEMITKTPDALTGTRYVIEGGAEKANEEVGAPTGTTLSGPGIFFTTRRLVRNS